ncbi:MMPL family transporter [Antrihabitans sp. YC2-6]|uniref:MMPL family transporter n=1 Tax=Antrihabitans sp. YC2-6 TaxID=2799498 RepID=UPI0018F31AB8|nr:MMPL family transporter [Antrihabitans sp. YC2-6]MBJ8346419.1 MMPL family transporter [Antrihabitans sp. YC2-6]
MAEKASRVLSRWPVFTIVAIAILVLLAGGFGGSFQSKLTEVQKNDNTAWLPHSAESTKVDEEAQKFLTVQTFPGFVVFHRESQLTADDKARVQAAQEKIAAIHGVDSQSVLQLPPARDGTAAAILAPLIAKQDGVSLTGEEVAETEQTVMDTAREAIDGAQGLEVYPAGPGGLFTAFIDALAGLDGLLLLVALGVVIVILLLVYRSPVLWIFPILSAILAIGLASMLVYFMADADIVTVNGQTQGVLFVLIIGAGTDYALLLISRYREELHEFENRFEAMQKAWRETAGAIVASAATVIVGLLCLSFSELGSNRGLGPVAAIGIACTLLIMMTFLPVSLALAGRWVFWPRRPEADHEVDISTHGLWGRISRAVVDHRRPAWIGATLLLLVGILGIGALDTDGLSLQQNFTNNPPAAVGQKLFDEKFDKGAGAPTVIATNANAADTVIRTVQLDPGVSKAPGSVCRQSDLVKLAELAKQFPSGQSPSGATPTCIVPADPIDGRILINATLVDSFDSPEALETVERLRSTLHAIPGADALVGGSSAATLDVQQAAVHDRNLIIPIVLIVIFLVLALLLRAVVAPILLIASVVLSFGAALGVSGFVFTHVFGFAGADQSFTLFVFVFLVALGIDYNIFLMTRVREETPEHGAREGIRRGLAVTGGVITSAGAVLAATFAMLGVLPIVAFAEIGFAVAFGVLLDTIVVRSILVPALAHDIGKKIWWPSKLAFAKD